MPDSKANSSSSNKQRRRPYKNQHQYLCLFLDTHTHTQTERTPNAWRGATVCVPTHSHTHQNIYAWAMQGTAREAKQKSNWESAAEESDRRGRGRVRCLPARLRCNAPAQRSLPLASRRCCSNKNHKCKMLSHTHKHSQVHDVVYLCLGLVTRRLTDAATSKACAVIINVASMLLLLLLLLILLSAVQGRINC